MRSKKLGKAGLEPLGREARARRNDEVARLRLRSNQASGVGDESKRVLYLASVGSTCAGQNRPPRVSLKKLYAEKFLELLDLMADGRRRDRQLLGALRKASMTGGRFEGEQRLQGGRQSRRALLGPLRDELV